MTPEELKTYSAKARAIGLALRARGMSNADPENVPDVHTVDERMRVVRLLADYYHAQGNLLLVEERICECLDTSVGLRREADFWRLVSISARHALLSLGRDPLPPVDPMVLKEHLDPILRQAAVAEFEEQAKASRSARWFAKNAHTFGAEMLANAAREGVKSPERLDAIAKAHGCDPDYLTGSLEDVPERSAPPASPE